MSPVASAMTLSDVCNKLPLPMMKSQCMAAAVDSHFSTPALNACARITDNVSNFGVFACVVAIKDRSYTPAEAQTCDNLTDVEATLGCFRSLGHKMQDLNGVSVETVSTDVQSALSFLYHGDARSAQDTLQLLVRKLSDGQHHL